MSAWNFSFFLFIVFVDHFEHFWEWKETTICIDILSRVITRWHESKVCSDSEIWTQIKGVFNNTATRYPSCLPVKSQKNHPLSNFVTGNLQWLHWAGTGETEENHNIKDKLSLSISISPGLWTCLKWQHMLCGGAYQSSPLLNGLGVEHFWLV